MPTTCAAVEERFGEMGSDEAGGAGNDDSRMKQFWQSQSAICPLNQMRDSGIPLITVSHMILISRLTDQFSM